MLPFSISTLEADETELIEARLGEDQIDLVVTWDCKNERYEIREEVQVLQRVTTVFEFLDPDPVHCEATE